MNYCLLPVLMPANSVLYTFKLDFAAIVFQTVEANEALATNKGQRIELHIESRPFVIADEQRLIEVVDNLINNAVKYSPKGEVISVIVRHKERQSTDARFRIMVRDFL